MERTVSLGSQGRTTLGQKKLMWLGQRERSRTGAVSEQPGRGRLCVGPRLYSREKGAPGGVRSHGVKCSELGSPEMLANERQEASMGAVGLVLQIPEILSRPQHRNQWVIAVRVGGCPP